MKTKIGFLLLAVIFSIEGLKACSCTNVPKAFDENIKANQVIFHGTVIEQITIPKDSNHFRHYHGLTKIKVHKWYQNQMQADTIYYANGQDAMCICSLEYLEKGEQIIIKALRERIYDLSFEYYTNLDKNFMQFMENYKNKPTVGYGICDVGLLRVKDQMVIGNISNNYQDMKWNQIHFIRRISKKWANKLESRLRKSEPKYQIWSLDKFAKLMTNKWNSI